MRPFISLILLGIFALVVGVLFFLSQGRGGKNPLVATTAIPSNISFTVFSEVEDVQLQSGDQDKFLYFLQTAVGNNPERKLNNTPLSEISSINFVLSKQEQTGPGIRQGVILQESVGSTYEANSRIFTVSLYLNPQRIADLKDKGGNALLLVVNNGFAKGLYFAGQPQPLDEEAFDGAVAAFEAIPVSIQNSFIRVL